MKSLNEILEEMSSRASGTAESAYYNPESWGDLITRIRAAHDAEISQLKDLMRTSSVIDQQRIAAASRDYHNCLGALEHVLDVDIHDFVSIVSLSLHHAVVDKEDYGMLIECYEAVKAAKKAYGESEVAE